MEYSVERFDFFCSIKLRYLQDSIPKTVQNLDLGYLWIPLPSNNKISKAWI